MNSVGVQVVTKLKCNMKQRLMFLGDYLSARLCQRWLFRKRAVVETVINQLKNKGTRESKMFDDCFVENRMTRTQQDADDRCHD